MLFFGLKKKTMKSAIRLVALVAAAIGIYALGSWIYENQSEKASFPVQSDTKQVLVSKKTVAFPYRPAEVIADPYKLVNVWADEPIDTALYSPIEIEAQLHFNKTLEKNFVAAYSPIGKEGKENEWSESDYEEITPYTWKWVDFEKRHADGSFSEISLRRPNWWLKVLGAEKVGAKVMLDMPEMGITGEVVVVKIKPNQLDTRFLEELRRGDYVFRPLTGTFKHKSNEVYYLRFDSREEPLGVTGNHPIWSLDRDDWVAAGRLRIGERVKTEAGHVRLASRVKSRETHPVYNLEVYRDHNFLVSRDKILAHNTCPDSPNFIVTQHGEAIPIPKELLVRTRLIKEPVWFINMVQEVGLI